MDEALTVLEEDEKMGGISVANFLRFDLWLTRLIYGDGFVVIIPNDMTRPRGAPVLAMIIFYYDGGVAKPHIRQ